MKKVCVIIAVIALISFLKGIPHLVEGIAQRGMSGVNYGRVVFPLLIGVVSVCLLKRKKE